MGINTIIHICTPSLVKNDEIINEISEMCTKSRFFLRKRSEI